MMRERIGSLVLRAYPPAVRLERGPEMLSMLLDAGEQSRLAFARECGSLVIGGIRERTHPYGRRILLVAAAMLVAILALGISAITLKRHSPAQNASSMRSIAARIRPDLRHGDLVFVAQPGPMPLAYKYLPDGLRYVTPAGLDLDLAASSHYTYSSFAGSYPLLFVKWLLNTLDPGQHVLFIRPLAEAKGDWLSRQSVLVRWRAAQLGEPLAQDRKLRAVSWAPRKYEGPCCVRDSALLYVET